MRQTLFFYIFPLLIPFILEGATSYVDYDLDGVDDAIDQCPNTPFDVLVDRFGCNMEKQKKGRLTLQAGFNRNIDSSYDNSTLLNLYLGYTYKNWDISLSSANYNTNPGTIVDLEDDIFLTAGYTFYNDNLQTRIFAGTKFAFLENTDRDNDYYVGTNITYMFNKKQDIFAYYSYTLSGDSDTVHYKNFHTFSVGTGYYVTPQWYNALSYSYVSSYYTGGESYQTLSWYSTYMMNSNTYIAFNYAYGLNESSYDHTFSLSIGAFFE